MSQYRFRAFDLVSNAFLAELPLEGPTFTSQLNAVGSWSGKLKLSDPRVQQIDWQDATQRWRTAVYVERDGVLVYGGILTTRNYDPAAFELTIGGCDFFGYFANKRLISWPGGASYTNADPLFIARDLINQAQTVWAGFGANASIGVIIGSETSGLSVTQAWNQYQLKSVGQAISDLAILDTGFDFAIDVAYDANGKPQKYLRLGYPRRGRSYSQNNLVINLEQAMAWSWPENDSTANLVWAVGAGNGTTQLIAHQQDPDITATPDPVLEAAVQCMDVTDQNRLQGRANAYLEAYDHFAEQPEITLRGSGYGAKFGVVATPQVHEYIVGDSFRIRSKPNERFVGGLDVTHRMVAQTLEPGDEGGMDLVHLTFQDVPTMA